MTNNVLITAWNDSGAGYLTRLLDGTRSIFAFPFEVLLGEPTGVGVLNHATLVKPCYRWNVFRDTNALTDHWRQSPPVVLRDIWADDELHDWKEGRKFVDLQGLKPRVTVAVQAYFASMKREGGIQSTSEATDEYLGLLERAFSNNPRPSPYRVIHCPCLGLDINHPLFFSIFPKAITVAIHPSWGYGNMHARNGITFGRYLSRWMAVNISALTAKAKWPQRILSLRTSSLREINVMNARKAYEFITERPATFKDFQPSLLGDDSRGYGFPYGGLTGFDDTAMRVAESQTESALTHASDQERRLYGECVTVYEELGR